MCQVLWPKRQRGKWWELCAGSFWSRAWQHGQGMGLAAWGWQKPPCSSSVPPCTDTVSTAVFQSQVTSDALSGLVSPRGQVLMWGEMLEAGLGQRKAACGSLGLKLDCAGRVQPGFFTLPKNGSCWDGDVGSSCGTISLQRSRGVKRRKEPTGDKSGSRERRGGSGRRFWRRAHGRAGDEQDHKLRAFSLYPGRGWLWWLLETHLGWGRSTKNNMKKNQHHCFSLNREKLYLMITGHLLLISGEGGNLNPSLKL